MATRVHLPSSGAAPVTPTDWEFTSQWSTTDTFRGVINRISTTMTSFTGDTGNTSPTTRSRVRYVLGPLAAQTIDGTLSGQIRCSENNAGANATPAVSTKVIQPNGNDRGVLLAPAASDSATSPHEMLTSLTNRIFETAAEGSSHTLTSQAVTAGDYLVIELGWRSATTTNRTITLSLGDDNATDLTAGNTTETTALNPWIEFSDTILTLHSATAAVSTADATCSGSATFTAPVYTGTAAVSAADATCSGSATFTEAGGTFTGTAAVSAADATCSASATFTAPVYTGTVAVSAADATCSASATFTAPVYTGTAAVSTADATCSASATFMPPVYTGTAAVTRPATTASGSATFTAPVYTGTVAVSAADATCSASAVVTNPTYTGTAAVTRPVATCAGSALFAPSLSAGAAAVTTQAATCSGSATFLLPPSSSVFGPFLILAV